tara:strand:+ start:10561 stop:11145 length:585 start_codon:yes stop_codon:yes gene_type:complete
MSKTTDKVIDLMNQDLAASSNGSIPKENIYKSLAAFQQECPVIHKGTKGYGYSYADLPAIFEVIMPILKKYNLGFTQLIDGTELRTILYHTITGDTIESCAAIPQNVEMKGMNTFQVYGSAITYFRRYALSSLLGIITDKDNDAAGEQVKKKRSLSNSEFHRGLESIQKGDYTLKQLKNDYTLTQEQLKYLKNV